MTKHRSGNQRGQSIVEYLIVIAIMVAAFTVLGGKLKTGVEGVGDSAQTAMDNGGQALEDISIGAQ